MKTQLRYELDKKNRLLKNKISQLKEEGRKLLCIIYRLIKNKHLLFTSVPKSVFYVYPSQHPLLDKMIEEKLVDKVLKSLPENVESLEKLLTKHKADGSILVIDDALTQLRPYLPQLFEVLSHRANCTIILVSQNNMMNAMLNLNIVMTKRLF